MKWKRFLTGIVMLCFTFSLGLPINADAADRKSDGRTTLTIKIPDSHKVTLDIKEHGAVTVEGEKYTGKTVIRVARLKKQTYEIKPDRGWQVDQVSYGKEGEQQEAGLKDSCYLAPGIHSDENVLTVTFKKGSGSESSETSGTSDHVPTGTSGAKTSGVKTGDATPIAAYLFLSLFSIGAGYILKNNRKEKI